MHPLPKYRISKCQNFLNKNFWYKFGYSMFTHKISWEKEILCGLEKKILMLSNEFSRDIFFLFAQAIKNIFFRETLCTDIEFLDIHPIFL